MAEDQKEYQAFLDAISADCQTIPAQSPWTAEELAFLEMIAAEQK